MTKHYDDLTIDEVMADPMIRGMMKADRVEPRRLEAMLRGLASLRARPAPGTRPVPFVPRKDAARATGCGLSCSL